MGTQGQRQTWVIFDIFLDTENSETRGYQNPLIQWSNFRENKFLAIKYAEI